MATDTETERRALALFEAALDVPETERAVWIDAATVDDMQVRARVRAMLDADRLASLRTGGALDGFDDDEPMPVRVGPYRIVRLIGRGGMGAVYLGERDAGDFERTVAIKLIKAGLLSDRLVERFVAERQTLAGLQHPHIARLYDGGTTEGGAPYIVMEHVDGQPILDWCEGRVRDARLRLFGDVCAAIAYAHSNLVVHRDITPSNVLVTGDGTAKLIDFGIARPAGYLAEEPTSRRSLASLTLTPGYAAPERLVGGEATIAADIYSLGKLLDALLEGPRDPELEAIVARATAADPADRYATADALRADIDARLRDLPVKAMPPRRRYLADKFVRRHRLGVAASVLAVVALLTALGGTVWALGRARVAQAEAEQRFSEVRQLANFMLFDLYDGLEPVTGNTKSLSQIADRAGGYLNTLAREDTTDPGLRLEAANGFKRLSDVLGNPNGANLGRREDAGKALRRSVAMLDALYRDQPGDVPTLRSLGQALYALSVFIYIAEDKSEPAIAPARRSAQLFQTIADMGKATAEDESALIEARIQALVPLPWLEKGKQADVGMAKLEQDAAALAARHPGNLVVLNTQARASAKRAYAMSWTYDAEKERAQYQTAVPVSDTSVAMYEQLLASHPDDRATKLGLLFALLTRGLIHYDLKDWPKANLNLSYAERFAEAMLAKDPDDAEISRRLQTYRSQRAPILIELGRKEEGIALARKTLVERETLSKSEPDNMGYMRDRNSARGFVGETLMLAGRKREGCEAFALALAGWREYLKSGEMTVLYQSNDVQPIEKAVETCLAEGLLKRDSQSQRGQ
jgi:eukaryotic-like serine/threonine-protein kinase